MKAMKMSPGWLIAPLLALVPCACVPSRRAAIVGEEPGGVAVAAEEESSSSPPGSGATARPSGVEERGRLVCLAEEMQRLHSAEVPPVHEHLRGFRTAAPQKEAAGTTSTEPPARYYTLLRTPRSEALFVDDRFSRHELVLNGRVFPGTSILEVTSFRWIRDGNLYEVYYWCEICSIRGVDPGPCACCQGEVELREEPVESD